jgi:osmoprotectant transport system ATP-binding protein
VQGSSWYLEAMFILKGVSRSFGAVLALERVNLTVESGKTTVLIGPSGCGKSTLLRLMLGLLAPTSGGLEFEGAPITPANAPALRQRMGYVVQGGGLFPHLTARENVALLARHLGWSRECTEARTRELALLARIEDDIWDRYPREISGGQGQRVALVRALMLDPEVLLLDEPLGALDPLVRADLQEGLAQVFSTLKKTVVLVTHDLGEAAFFGHTLVLMQGGRIVQEGSLKELQETPADPFVTRFLEAQGRLVV